MNLSHSTAAETVPPGSTAISSLAFSGSSLRNQRCEGSVTNHRLKKDGNIFPSAKTKPRAFVLTQSEWRRLAQSAFREHTHGRAKPAQILADELECSPKTAQSWLDGDSTPAGLLDLRAMARVPAYAALKREIAEMETTLDPRLQAKYQELHRLTLDLANGGER